MTTVPRVFLFYSTVLIMWLPLTLLVAAVAAVALAAPSPSFELYDYDPVANPAAIVLSGGEMREREKRENLSGANLR